MTSRLPLLPLTALALALAACAPAPVDAGAGEPAAATTTATAAAPAATVPPPPASPSATADPVAAALPRVLVHKSPTCGCCTAWVAHMQQAGFPVDVVETVDLEAVRKKAGVPAGKASCHTAVVEGYFVEGHVPAEDVARLLRERPDARGLTVPGMPVGSPGMEVPSGAVQPYAVLLVAHDGTTTEFSRHGEP